MRTRSANERDRHEERFYEPVADLAIISVDGWADMSGMVVVVRRKEGIEADGRIYR